MKTPSFLSTVVLTLGLAVGGCTTQHHNWTQTKTGGAGAATETQYAPKPKEYFKNFNTPPLRDFEPPQAEKAMLDNGVIVYLLEDHELPLMDLSIIVRAGGFWEPADKVGLAALTGQQLRAGGSAACAKDVMNATLEGMGARIESGVGSDQGSVSMSCLTKDFDTVFGMMLDLMKAPVFDAEQIELSKEQSRGALARRNDDAGDIAGREQGFELYGKDSVYAREQLPAHINAISRDDLVNFYNQYFHAGNMFIGVGGDFNRDDIIAKLNKTIGSWKPGESFQPDYPKVEQASTRYVAVANKADSVQSNISICKLNDLDRLHPDYVPLYLASSILGHGFSSRLFREVRTKNSLAYSVFGTYRPEYSFPGRMEIGIETKSESTAAAIRIALQTVKEFTSALVTEEELDSAKEGLLNSFVFQFASPGANLERTLRYHYRGIPSDYIERFMDAVRKTTREDILRVAKKYYDTKDFMILVVGNKAAFDTDLSEFGEVRDLDISLPKPVTSAQAGTNNAGDTARGQELVRGILSKNDAKALAELKAVRTSGPLKLKMQGQEIGGEFSAISTVDGQTSMTGLIMGSEFKQIVNKDGAWMKPPNSPEFMAIPAENMQEMRNEVVSDYTAGLLKGFADGSLRVTALGVEKGGSLEILQVNGANGLELRLLVNADTWSVERIEKDGDMGMQTQFLRNYKNVGGLWVPGEIEVKVPGQPVFISTMETVDLLTEYDQAEFADPTK